jgi:hypothetical protein
MVCVFSQRALSACLIHRSDHAGNSIREEGTVTFLLFTEIGRGVFNAFVGATRDNARVFANLLALLLFGLWLAGAFFIGQISAPSS